MAIYKLQINVPLVGTIKYADYVPPSQPGYSEQIKLNGTWDQIGEAHTWLALPCAAQLAALGIISAQPDAQNKYTVLSSQRIRIIKVQEGRSHRTTVTLEGGPAPAPAPSATLTPGQNGRQAQVQGAPEPQEAPQVKFRRTVKTMTRCLEEAKAMWLKLFPDLAAETLAEKTGHTASSLFIFLTGRNILAPADPPPAPPPAEPAQLEALDAVAQRLGWGTEHMRAELTKLGMKPEALSKQHADVAVKTFTALAEDLERQAREAQYAPLPTTPAQPTPADEIPWG